MRCLVVVSDSARQQERLVGLLTQQFQEEVRLVAGTGDEQAVRLASIAVVDLPPHALATLVADLRRMQPLIKVLALVPFGDMEAERLSVHAGADEVLLKPVTGARLRLSIDNLMRICGLEREIDALRRNLEEARDSGPSRQRAQ